MHILFNYEFHCPPRILFSVVDDDEKDGIEQLVEVLKWESTIVLETDVAQRLDPTAMVKTDSMSTDRSWTVTVKP